MSTALKMTTSVSVVSGVQFEVMDSAAIKNAAVVRVTDHLLYANGVPVTNGLFDPKMGTCDRRIACGTCGFSTLECPGHFGSINLAYPVYHVGYIDVILKILRSVCFFCSAVLVEDKERRHLARGRDCKARLAIVAAFAKRKSVCWKCGGGVPGYQKQNLSIRSDFSKVSFVDSDERVYCSRTFTSAEARIILSNISSEDCKFLGLDPKVCRPERLVLTTLVVIPPSIRPSVISSDFSHSRGQDDLTTKLADIVKSNAVLRKILSREAESIPSIGVSVAALQAIADLTFHIGTFMNNDQKPQGQSLQRSGMPSKSITSRLKGKDGRIRGSLMGKRVNFSARSVVSPSGSIDIDQVGVPARVAKALTIPEVVTDSNFSRLHATVLKGADDLSGAFAVRRRDQRVLLAYGRPSLEAERLQVGDVVERYLRDGDHVLFNRQPSLHRGSMMSLRVKIVEGKTFHANLAITPTYNCDFDGDEMNIHVPQDPESQCEARMLLAVPNHIVSPQASKPCMGGVQDAVIGAFLLTESGVSLTRRQVCELYATLAYPKKTLDPRREIWSGKQAFSLLLPRGLCYENARAAEGLVRIVDGELLEGRICRASIGTASGSLPHVLWLHYGPEEAARFLSDAQRLVNHFLTWRGFSTRLSDCEPSRDLLASIGEIIDHSASVVGCIEGDAQLLREIPEQAEDACADISNKILTNVGRVVHASMSLKDNHILQTVTCGSKGNLINVAQLIGCVGQQSLEGKRIHSARNGILHVPIDCDEKLRAVATNGFIKSSYFEGLTSWEFFFHAMAGREGLSDTAVKTSSTGYMQRRLMKAMETLVLQYDGTVRNASGCVVQFSYGADGYDACFLTKASLRCLLLPDSELRKEFGDSEEWSKFRLALRAARSLRSNVFGEFADTLYTPCRVDLILINLGVLGRETEDAPRRREAVEGLCAKLRDDGFASHSLVELHLRWALRSSVLRKYTLASVEACVARLEEDLRRARAAPGEAVGAIAAMSLSQNMTQLTLNTFHYAGVASQNVTLGVPRVKELVDCSRSIKTPIAFVPLRQSVQASPAATELVRACLPYLTLERVVIESKVLEDPEFFSSVLGGEDASAAADDRLYFLNGEAPAVFSPWIIRLKLDALFLQTRRLATSHVASAAINFLGGTAQVVYHHDEADAFLRIRPLIGCPASMKPELFFRPLCEELSVRLCRELTLGGIPGIRSARVVKKTLFFQNDRLEIEQQRVVALEVHGLNFRGLVGMAEAHESLTSSNDVHDVLQTLGIEAAANVLFHQLMQCICSDGSVINERHGLLLVNLMTHLGYLLPISRHGINRAHTRNGLNAGNGILSRSSFEECLDQILEAALKGEFDPCTCVSSRVMLGRRARLGTGICSALTERSHLLEAEAASRDETCDDSEVESVAAQATQEDLSAALRSRAEAYAPSSPKVVRSAYRKRGFQ